MSSLQLILLKFQRHREMDSFSRERKLTKTSPQMLELLGKAYKAAIITLLSDVKENMLIRDKKRKISAEE